jgi:tocopherol cyclase
MPTTMKRRLRRPRWLHPEGYHGRDKKPPFFEGWYFKVVDRTTAHRYAVIPGISLSPAGGGPHSFVQVLDGASDRVLYQRYAVEDFAADERGINVRVGPNTFSWHGFHLDLDNTDLPLRGDIRFLDPKPWPVTLISPGIMGWFSYVPRMECYHGVLSFDHALSGILYAGEGALDFNEGRGYIEKDWGQSFPSGWVWMQTNHFEKPGISLTASIAVIPWLGYAFPGFIVGLFRHGTLYRFATYTGARTTHLSISRERVAWTLEDALYHLEIIGHRAGTGRLRGPSRHDMGRPVPETLSARVDVTLRARHSDTAIFTGSGRCAGMEVGGDIAALLSMVSRKGDVAAPPVSSDPGREPPG